MNIRINLDCLRPQQVRKGDEKAAWIVSCYPGDEGGRCLCEKLALTASPYQAPGEASMAGFVVTQEWSDPELEARKEFL